MVRDEIRGSAAGELRWEGSRSALTDDPALIESNLFCSIGQIAELVASQRRVA